MIFLKTLYKKTLLLNIWSRKNPLLVYCSISLSKNNKQSKNEFQGNILQQFSKIPRRKIKSEK